MTGYEDSQPTLPATIQTDPNPSTLSENDDAQTVPPGSPQSDITAFQFGACTSGQPNDQGDPAEASATAAKAFTDFRQRLLTKWTSNERVWVPSSEKYTKTARLIGKMLEKDLSIQVHDFVRHAFVSIAMAEGVPDDIPEEKWKDLLSECLKTNAERARPMG